MQNYTPFTLDNLPPGVDERQCFTAEEFYRVPEDFSLERELAKYKSKRPIPANTDIRQVQIFADQRLGLSWDEGVITFQLYFPTDFQPHNLIYTINGEIARVICGNEVILDRTQELDFESILQKNYMAMES